MKIVLTVLYSDYRLEPVEQKTIESYTGDINDEGELWELNEEINICGMTYSLFLSFNCRNKGLSLSLMSGKELLLRYGGLVTDSSHLGMSLGDDQIIDFMIECLPA